MMSNLEKYKKDLQDLIIRGELLHNAIQFECFPAEFKKEFDRVSPEGAKGQAKFAEFAKTIPSFRRAYQVGIQKLSF